ncbi:MAG: AAA family ATPase [Candidatus Omnitrophota bacterium]
MKIIGITGPNASGKGEAAGYLKTKGFEYNSLSDILREKAKEAGIEESRENLIALGNKLRSGNGAAFLAQEAIKRMDPSKNYVIDSIRNPAEIAALKKIKGFRLIGIDAPIETRFRRIVERKRPGDPKTLREFIEKEERENVNDVNNQQLANCLKSADTVIINGSTLTAFHKKIDEAIK